MKKHLLIIPFALSLCGPAALLAQTSGPGARTPRPTAAQGQTAPAPQGAQQRTAAQTPRPAGFDLSDYGVQFEPDARLIVVMAALDAAGWDPTLAGQKPSVFRELVRREQAGLDPDLRKRMQDFYNRYKLGKPGGPQVTAAEEAARYVSLAYTLGQPPTLDVPPRTDDLPAGVLDVLDFAPLVREFYRQTGMDERLRNYLNMHRAEGDRMRPGTVEMVRAVLAYLHTQPVTTIADRVAVSADTQSRQKKGEAAKKMTVLREKQRRFLIVPDLLAAPGAINFRIIGDDYYAILPPGTNASSSELRRAYIQYLVDPLILRFGRDIAARRDAIKALLEAESKRTQKEFAPDPFLVVTRSLVAAADVRMEEIARLRSLQLQTSGQLAEAADEAARSRVVKESQEQQRYIADAAVAQLAEAYERGAVLSFYFAEQLRGMETAGFDVSSFISDMIASIDTTREMKRPDEYAAVVRRYGEARKRLQEERARAAEASEAAHDERRVALFKSLTDVDALLRVNNYTEAETRLQTLRQQYVDEPRIYFALGQAASLSAQDAFDETLQAQRLTRSLAHFQQAVLLASRDTDAALLSRAHVARGRILAFLERREEAAKEFDAAIALGDQKGGAYKEALNEKTKLAGQK